MNRSTRNINYCIRNACSKSMESANLPGKNATPTLLMHWTKWKVHELCCLMWLISTKLSPPVKNWLISWGHGWQSLGSNCLQASWRVAAKQQRWKRFDRTVIYKWWATHPPTHPHTHTITPAHTHTITPWVVVLLRFNEDALKVKNVQSGAIASLRYCGSGWNPEEIRCWWQLKAMSFSYDLFSGAQLSEMAGSHSGTCQLKFREAPWHAK